MTQYIVLSAILFTIGCVGVLTRRNALVVFMCVELMLNACNLAFVAYGAALDLTPIWLLHALLLPMNGWRLLQTLMAGMPTHVALRRARLGTLVRMRNLA